MIPEKPKGLQATPDQWKAIATRGNNLLVSASAGSGKTKVLVERILMHIQEGIDINELLVVTFTELAAKEMKERLRAKLEEAIEKSTDEILQQRFAKQLQLIPSAMISTIHSFCMKVIRRYFYLAGIDPVFTMMDEIEGQLLQEKVWRALEEELLEHPEYEEVFSTFSNDRSDDGITNTVYRLYQYSRSKREPKTWLSNLTENYSVGSDYASTPFVKTYVKPALIEELSYLVTQYDQLLKDIELLGAPKHQAVLEDDLDFVKAVLVHIQEESYVFAYQTFEDRKFKNWSTAKVDETVKESLDEIKAIREGLKKDFQKIKEDYFAISPEVQLQQMTKVNRILSKLSDIAVMFYDRFQDEKHQLNKLDFSDLEHDTLRILTKLDSNGQKIASEYYQNHFKEVMVDEYQDVNRVQEAILELVSKPDNRFMVGDVKQSIYGFRLADPSLFREKYEAYAEGKSGERIVLAENFRSRDEVLSFTNKVFQQIMNKELGQVEYDDVAALKTGNLSYSQDDDKSSEIILIEDVELDEKSDDLEDAEGFEKVENEIHYVAQRIQEMIKTPFEVMNDKADAKRPVTYGDFAILSSTKSNNDKIESIFAAYGIPVNVQKAQSYFKRTEITTMVSLLKVIDNPLQDIPLVAVLRSGLIGLDEIALAHIRKLSKNTSYYEAVCQFVSDFKLQEVDYYDSKQQLLLKERLEGFITLLNKWRDSANNESIAQLIWEIYMDTHFLEYVHGQSNGAQRAVNLHALYEHAHQYESSSFKGVRNFIRFIEALQKKEKDLDEAPIARESNAVQVMTIHASKGLEFPVVFLIDTNRKFNMQDLKASIMCSDEIGVGTNYFDLSTRITYPTVQAVATRNFEKKKLLSEEMRKLYVAMTRAREKLIVVGTLKNYESFKKKYAFLINESSEILPYQARFKSGTFLNWMLLSAIREQYKITPEIVTKTDIVSNSKQYIHEISGKEVFQEDWHEYYSETDSPRELKSRVQQMLQTIQEDYQFEAESKTTSYQSVSELKRVLEDPIIEELAQNSLIEEGRRAIYLSPTLEQPRFMETATASVSGAQRGSALHLLMQKVDFASEITLESLEQLLKVLVDSNEITPEVAAKVPVTQAYEFFQSPFGQWIVQNSHALVREQAFSYVLEANEFFKSIQTDDLMMIHGIIDGYIELDDEIIVFDYKTDYVVDSTEGIQGIVRKYKEQLNIYADALAISCNKKVTRKVLCLLSINKNIDIDTLKVI